MRMSERIREGEKWKGASRRPLAQVQSIARRAKIPRAFLRRGRPEVFLLEGWQGSRGHTRGFLSIRQGRQGPASFAVVDAVPVALAVDTEDPSKDLAGVGLFRASHVLRRTLRHNAPAALPAFRP